MSLRTTTTTAAKAASTASIRGTTWRRTTELTDEEIAAEVCSSAASPAAAIFAGDSLDGFSFVSNYSARSAPYLASWFFEPPTQGDPPIGDSGFASPLSPARQLAQGEVPEPEAMALFGLGVLGLTLARLRRRKI
jgi:hypothetical protein